jgi:hypothetical protein
VGQTGLELEILHSSDSSVLGLQICTISVLNSGRSDTNRPAFLQVDNWPEYQSDFPFCQSVCQSLNPASSLFITGLLTIWAS